MAQSIKLSEQLLQEARSYAVAQSRSVPKQIEHWSRIGKIAEENPDLTYTFIHQMLLAQAEMEEGLTTSYTLG